MTQHSNNPPYKQCTMTYTSSEKHQIHKNDTNNFQKKTSNSLLKPFSKKENSKKAKKYKTKHENIVLILIVMGFFGDSLCHSCLFGGCQKMYKSQYIVCMVDCCGFVSVIFCFAEIYKNEN